MKIILSILFIVLNMELLQCNSVAQPTPNKANKIQNKQDTINSKSNIKDISLSTTVDSILVIKNQHKMYVYNNNILLKIYRISLGTTPVGPKHFQGDRRTPEGIYHIFDKNPNSMAHKSLGIDYPNNKDRKYAKSYGQPTIGDIKIHGLLNGYEQYKDDFVNEDWTWGCIAVTNEDIDELYEYVKIGAVINIQP